MNPAPPPKLTNEQWKQIEQQLSGTFGSVELKADGYKLTLRVQRLKALRLCIVVFVDGVCQGSWYSGEAPEAKKFCRESCSWLYPLKQRKDAATKLKSRGLDPFLREHYKGVAEKFVAIWVPYWNTPASLIRHLRKTCTDVEIVSIGFQE